MILFCEECGGRNSVVADENLVKNKGFTCQHCGFLSPLANLPGILPLLSGETELSKNLLCIRRELEQVLPGQAESLFIDSGSMWLEKFKPTLFHLPDLIELIYDGISDYQSKEQFRQKITEELDQLL